MTKVEMLKICNKLELYVSPNLKKDETARRVAREILDNPCDVLHVLNKQELQLVDEFVTSGPNHYAVRKMRNTFYKLPVRPITRARKSSLHHSSEEGLLMALAYMTIIESAKRLGHECKDFLVRAWKEAIYGNNDLEAMLQPVVVAK